MGLITSREIYLRHRVNICLSMKQEKHKEKDKWTPKVGEKELQLPAYYTE